ncbi:MAG: hypothetical protein A2Y62_10670 [Candidatus Fischerbacteria bacterium RBG_13_37_8]|uniref:Fibronectin type-III domain-containing protein n=1 Tax=Candidatus Fischerbacteria bacterium RBG_13_37_8 TaxID=1817863 RepID=A0A1F5VU24_9BACT|nr:MAG: hypothetical protein A2Y62_10670 [Candidatus Fischerbacteria bacterium RBG_13_37_8]
MSKNSLPIKSREKHRHSNSALLFSVMFALCFIIAFSVMTVPSTVAKENDSKKQNDDSLVKGTFKGVFTAVKFDISPPLAEIPPIPPDGICTMRPDEESDSGNEGPYGVQDMDSALQSINGPLLIPAPSVTFPALGNLCNCSPPDPNGDIGPNHFVIMTNLSFAIYNRSGVLLYGPALNNTLWAGFGGACQTQNSGDPIVLYDPLADRWLMTQFTAASPYMDCVALSTSSNPLGTYYRWAFPAGGNVLPDYPKYGVWPDAYYLSTREVSASLIGAYALNRAQMLAGNPTPQVIQFLVAQSYNNGDGLLPADFDGERLPPAGSPNYWLGTMDNGGPYGAPQDAITLWKYQVDWVTPANSTFTLTNTIPVAAFDSVFPCTPTSRSCIPQPGTTNKVDILSYRQRPLFRNAYRNYGTHESLVTNQSVDVNNGVTAGARWYEIRSPNSSPVIYQQGTYAPGTTDGIFRWMGSIAMDSAGNMGLGYSTSNATAPNYPSIKYTGRLSTDPLGTMPQGEQTIVNGAGSQTSSTRWGDYTSMSVDPVDDCTFWHFNQYFATSSANGWATYVGAFKFNECTPRGAGEPGPILLAKSSNLVISWPALPDGCGNRDYAVYKGDLAGLLSTTNYNHLSVTCTTSNTTTYSMAMPSDASAYFLVTSESAFDEGSYGRNSGGTERPQAATSPCRSLQTIGACPP